MKTIRRIACTLLAIVLLYADSLPSYAAPKQMPDGTVFDAEYYAQSNPDVVNALGTTEKALYDHYLKYGKAEGRKPYADATVQSPSAGSTGTTAITTDRIIALKTKYPEGMAWTTDNKYTYTAKTEADWWKPTFTASGCQAFAYTLQDELLGTNSSTPRTQKTTPLANLYGGGSQWTHDGNSGCWVPVGYDGNNETVNNYFDSFWPNIKPGDVLADGIHAFMVMSKSSDSITIVEGNYNGKVHWGRKITKDQLRKGLYCIYGF